jgi:hypothetical protein
MARDPYRRHTRRIRRAMRKNGNNPYGVLIIGPDEPFGLIIAAALGRWAFRHRSAFYPFWVALVAFLAANAAPKPALPLPTATTRNGGYPPRR